MKKILWVSKNEPLEPQILDLKKLFGDDIEITQDKNPFSDAADIVRRYKLGGYDEMVLIAPLSVCRVITDWGFKPLWSEMRIAKPNEPSDIEVYGNREKRTGNKRNYIFIRFRRLEGINMEFSDLDT